MNADARGLGQKRVVTTEVTESTESVLLPYGVWAVVLCRPIPVLAEATVVFAGLVRAPIGRFFWLTTASNLGIAVGYAAVGAYSMRLDSFLMAFIGAIVVPGLALVAARWLPRKTDST